MNAALILDQVAHRVVDASGSKATLDVLNRRFEPGQFSVVGGASGSGKTTLLSILSLAVRASQGMIHYGDVNLTAFKPDKATQWRRDMIGMIFQTSRLIRFLSVREHIQMAAAMRNAPSALANGTRLLGDLGLADKLAHRPEQLSGGEKQRVAVAQALCFEPAIILADEPTAALDATNAELVAHSLRTYAHAAGAIVICVSHDRAVIDAADDLLMLARP